MCQLVIIEYYLNIKRDGHRNKTRWQEKQSVLGKGFLIQAFEDETKQVEIDNFSAAVGFEILEDSLVETEQFVKDYVDCEGKEYLKGVRVSYIVIS